MNQHEEGATAVSTNAYGDPGDQAYERTYGRACALIEANRPDQAIGLFSGLLAHYPNQAGPVRLGLARAHACAARPSEALAEARAAVAAMPQNADAQFLLGSLLNQAEDQAGAERSLRAALALDPEHVLSSCALVDLLVKQDRCAQAFPLAQLAIRLAPQEPDSHIAMGRVYEEIDPRIARRAYKKAVQLDPESPTASMELATFDFNHGSKSGIVRAVARAVAWRPQNQVARPLVDLTLIVLTLSLGKIHGSCLALTILVQLVLWWFGAPARLCLAPAVPALISALLLSWVICRPVRTNLPDGGRPAMRSFLRRHRRLASAAALVALTWLAALVLPLMVPTTAAVMTAVLAGVVACTVLVAIARTIEATADDIERAEQAARGMQSEQEAPCPM